MGYRFRCYWDIVGALYDVGYFRQNPNNTFTLYRIGNTQYCHWVYIAPLCLKCIPKMDIILTDSGGAHILYENKTVIKFADSGYLESSILRIKGGGVCNGYVVFNACSPKDSSLTISWRVSKDSNTIITQPYSSPYYIKTGQNIQDSFPITFTDEKYFQYRVEFRGDSQDVAVLKEIKLKYECQTQVEEKEKEEGNYYEVKYKEGEVLLTLRKEEVVSLNLYDISGRKLFSIYEGKLLPGEYRF